MCHGLPEGRKSECTVTSHLLGAPGTDPVGGVEIPTGIIICCRPNGIRMMIVTDEVVIIIDVP